MPSRTLLLWAPLSMMLLAASCPFVQVDGPDAGTKENGVTEIVNSLGMKLVLIPAGTFTMGSPPGELWREDSDEGSEQQHVVEITKPLYLGVYEVTQKQFEKVMNYNPSYFSKNGKGKAGEDYYEKPAGGKEKVPTDTSAFPVENVSWYEASEFCDKLNAIQGERGRMYRLPTEAEWEYSCRGGTSTYQVLHVGDSFSSKQVNFNGNRPYGRAASSEYLERTCKVGSYEKVGGRNGFGLCDMHGNVWEWCADWSDKDYYSRSECQDPQGSPAGSKRVARGGGWGDAGKYCRSACRYSSTPESRFWSVGFRVVMVPEYK